MTVTPIHSNYNCTQFNNIAHRDFVNHTNTYQQEFSSMAPKTKNKQVKAATFLTSLAAVGTTTAVIAKRQGFSLNPQKIFKTQMKDWAICKFYNPDKPAEKFIKYETGEILSLGTSSVAGGLAGGIIFDDKKHIKAKARESLNQLVGNIFIPICAMGRASYLYAEKVYKNGKTSQEMVEALLPEIKGTATFTKYTNKAIKAIPTIGITAGALGAGIIAGNKFSNYINEKVYKIKVDRNVKATDFAPHLDDLCLASSLMAPNSEFFSAISRLVPAALIIPGYEVGTAVEKS